MTEFSVDVSVGLGFGGWAIVGLWLLFARVFWAGIFEYAIARRNFMDNISNYLYYVHC
jgi:hypothetical protein